MKSPCPFTSRSTKEQTSQLRTHIMNLRHSSSTFQGSPTTKIQQPPQPPKASIWSQVPPPSPAFPISLYFDFTPTRTLSRTMTSTSSSSHYTLLFTCNLSITIPCASSSPDHGKTLPIDKLCPQCAPHPHLIPVVFDQAHWDEMQALKAARKRTGSVGTQYSQGEVLSIKSASDKSETYSVLSSNSKSSTKSKISIGFSRLKGLVRKEDRKQVRFGWNPSVISDFPQNGVASVGYGEEESREQVKCEEARKEKEREIREKLDGVEREIVVEKVMEVERAMRVLA